MPAASQKIACAALGVDEIVARGETLPPFDVHVPIMSLPGIFRTTPQTIPLNIPYIQADVALANSWRQKIEQLGPGLKVGLVWAGQPIPVGRSMRRARKALALAQAQPCPTDRVGPPLPPPVLRGRAGVGACRCQAPTARTPTLTLPRSTGEQIGKRVRCYRGARPPHGACTSSACKSRRIRAPR